MSKLTIPLVKKAPSFVGDGRIKYIEKNIPKPGKDELLIQVKANALCGSERDQYYNGSNVTPGHEAAGFVVAAGPETSTPLNTHGVVYLMDFCGKCQSCLSGYTNQCLQKRGDMGFNKDGGYGPYELIHENIFFPIDIEIPYVQATLLLDIMGTGRHAIDRALSVKKEIRSVLITGAGPIGLGVLGMVRKLLNKDVKVLISDFVEYRLRLAEKLGGIPIDLNKVDLNEGLNRQGLKTVSVVIETSGKEKARCSGLNLISNRGVMVCVGHGEGLTLQVSSDLIAPERAILGSEYFPYSDFYENYEILKMHKQYFSQIITHELPVKNIKKAFQLFLSGNTGKVVIVQ